MNADDDDSLEEEMAAVAGPSTTKSQYPLLAPPPMEGGGYNIGIEDPYGSPEHTKEEEKETFRAADDDGGTSFGQIPGEYVTTSHPVLQTASTMVLRGAGTAYNPEANGNAGATRVHGTVRRMRVKKRTEDAQDLSPMFVENDEQQQQMLIAMQDMMRRSIVPEQQQQGPRNVAASLLTLPQSKPTTMQPDNAVQNAQQTYARQGVALLVIDEIAERMMSERAPKKYREYKKKKTTVGAEHEEWAPSLALRQAEALRINLSLVSAFLAVHYPMSAEKRGWFN